MTTDHKLQFNCIQCKEPVSFTLLDQINLDMFLACNECGKRYCFDDSTIVRYLRQFESLCQQIHASKEILGATSVAIDVGNHHVKVPFNILLTRLNSVIELTIDNQKIVFSYRVEPLKEQIFSTAH